MTGRWKRAATAAAMLAATMALGACGDRVENTEKPQSDTPNVEINRQGMDGAKDEKQAQGVANNTATAGSTR
jgi:hypothetical protein